MTSDEKTVARTPHSLQPTALSLDDIVGCRTSILWSLRTLQVGAAALDRSYEDFAEDVVSDDDYTADLIELYKAIELDKRYAEQRREITDRVLAWIGAALAARSDPAHQAALREPIDPARLPEMPGIPAWTLNDLRPGLPWPSD